MGSSVQRYNKWNQLIATTNPDSHKEQPRAMIAQVLPEVDLPVSSTLALETMRKRTQDTSKPKRFVAMATPEASGAPTQVSELWSWYAY